MVALIKLRRFCSEVFIYHFVSQNNMLELIRKLVELALRFRVKGGGGTGTPLFV